MSASEQGKHAPRNSGSISCAFLYRRSRYYWIFNNNCTRTARLPISNYRRSNLNGPWTTSKASAKLHTPRHQFKSLKAPFILSTGNKHSVYWFCNLYRRYDACNWAKCTQIFFHFVAVWFNSFQKIYEPSPKSTNHAEFHLEWDKLDPKNDTQDRHFLWPGTVLIPGY